MSQAPTLAALASDLEAKRCTSRSLLEACLAAVDDATGEGRRAFIHVDHEAARAQADAIDALRARGAAPSAFAGIPISVKDLFDIAGQVTRAGSTVLADRAPATGDAPIVARLRQAGFVVVGRTNMTEFAFSGLGLNPHYGTPRNPWQREQDRIPGGSSSGAAVSVTDGMAHAAIGTDTGGSVRIPSAFTGLVGYKATARRIPSDGMVPLSLTLDSIGPIARSVACCATLDAVMAGEATETPSAARIRGLRFAQPRTCVLDEMDQDVARDFERALARLSGAGARVVEIDLPELAELPRIQAHGTFSSAESFAWHRELLATRAAGYDPRVRSRIEAGARQSAADYLDLLAARRRFITQVEARLEGFDAFVMPTIAVVAPRLAELAADENYYRINRLVLRNSSVVNFLDGCAVSLPMHARGGPPTGLSLACRGGADHHLFQCALAVETVLQA